MAMYLFNCSVDTPDQFRDNIPENLLHNDQESMIELVLEMGLGMEDAVPEKEDADADNKFSTILKLVFDLKSFSDLYTCPIPNLFRNKVNGFYFSNLNFKLPYIPIISPPPEY